MGGYFGCDVETRQWYGNWTVAWELNQRGDYGTEMVGMGIINTFIGHVLISEKSWNVTFPLSSRSQSLMIF